LSTAEACSATAPLDIATGEKLLWLQSLRGVAALMVLFFHMGPHWALVPQLQPFSKLMHWGFSGVDIFFVLSGFVVYQSGVNSIPKRGFFDFIKKRFARIYTTYWVTFLLVTAISIFILGIYPKSLEQIVKSFFLLYPKFWDNWIAVAWSLTYELYFYLVLGILLLAPKKYQSNAIIAAILFFTAWNLSWLIFQTDKVLGDAHPLRFFLCGFIIEFLLGALIGAAFNARPHFFNKTKLVISICLVAVVFGFILGSQSHYFNRVEIMRLFSYGLMAIGMLIIALKLELLRYKPKRLLVMIGDSSFSLYLLHSILLSVLGEIRHRYLGSQQEYWLIYSLLMPVIVVALSYSWYKLVEIRTIRLIRKF
jgi:exopolysaccharide production protein ExoZ